MKHFKLMKGVLACLLSLALVVTCFTSVGAKAEETSGSGTATVTAPTAVSAEFKWATNTVEADSAAIVYVLKAKTGNTVKKGTKSVTLAKASQTATKFSATMTDLGIKKAKKEVYLYVCDKEFEENGTNISANLVIKAPAAKKVTGTIDYTKADGSDFNVISATAVDDKKAAIKDPEIWWSTEADGTYYQVNDSTKAATPRKYTEGDKADAPNGFDGRTLREMLAAGGGTIYIKMAGKDGATGDAQFGSQAVKVKIAKQAKAPNVKLDAKKDTLSLKNGFDFGYAVLNPTTKEYDVQKWFTVLPQLKTAAVKTSDASIVATTAYTPLAKKDSNAGKEVVSESGDKTYSYTAYKFKALSVDTIIKTLTANTSYSGGDCVIAVRKSATEKKPASAASYIELAAMSDKPLVYTQDNVKGEFLVATSADFDKKGIIAGTVVPYPGSVSGEGTIATKGYDDTFEVGKISGSGEIVNADTNGSTYEFAILAQKDLVATGEKAIDVSTIAWKKFDPAKTKITSKLKTKYSLLDGTKTTAQLDTVSAKVEPTSTSGDTAAQFSGVKNFIVIRRTGNSKSTLRASSWIYLYVVKNGKTYELYSTVDNGAEAFKYTIKFVKYQKVGDTYTWDLASDVEDVSVWAATGDKKYVALPESTTAKLFKASAASGADVLGNTPEAVTSVSGGTNKGKYEVTGVSGGHTEYVAVREYANVKIVAEISISGETTKKEETLVTITNGKSSISGDTNTYYVGTEFSIASANIPAVSSVSGYETGSATSVSGGVTVDGNNFKATVNTAEETVVKVAYTRTAEKYAVTQTLNDATLENITGIDSNQATYKTNVTFKVATTPTKTVVDKVTYKVGSADAVEITADASGVYTIPGDKILGALTITVTVKDEPSEG